jgi:large subunit ribosomal protein L5
MARLLEKYRDEIKGSLKEKFAYKNVMQIPTVKKVVINMGVGGALKNERLLTEAVADLGLIAGQKAVINKAKVSVATWRLREGNAIGCKVTLRGIRMWEFLDRAISLAIPRIKDFRGLSPRSFDGRGNYTFGISEKAIFPEINQARMEYKQGMDVTVVTTAKTNEEAKELLTSLGFPFRN